MNRCVVKASAFRLCAVLFCEEHLLNLNFANNSAGSCAVTAGDRTKKKSAFRLEQCDLYHREILYQQKITQWDISSGIRSEGSCIFD